MRPRTIWASLSPLKMRRGAAELDHVAIAVLPVVQELKSARMFSSVTGLASAFVRPESEQYRSHPRLYCSDQT
jgi:hypothetical protein